MKKILLILTVAIGFISCTEDENISTLKDKINDKSIIGAYDVNLTSWQIIHSFSSFTIVRKRQYEDCFEYTIQNKEFVVLNDLENLFEYTYTGNNEAIYKCRFEPVYGKNNVFVFNCESSNGDYFDPIEYSYTNVGNNFINLCN